MKILLFIFTLFLPVLELAALDLICGLEAEARVAAFYPTSRKFRRVYQEWDADYQLEISKPICWGFSGWINGSFLTEKGRGHANRGHHSSHIDIIPISFGAKYSYCINPCLKVYAGLGATYTFLRIRDNSPFVRRHLDKEAWGGIAKSGLQYIWNAFFIDLFADYLYQPFDFSSSSRIQRNRVNVGGVKFGIGLGVFI